MVQLTWLTKSTSVLITGHHPHFEKRLPQRNLETQTTVFLEASFMIGNKTRPHETKPGNSVSTHRERMDKNMVLHSYKGILYLVKMNEQA